MNFKNLNTSFLICTVYVIFISLSGCNRDDVITPPVNTTADVGAYILSEGSFGSVNSGRLSFYNLSKDSFYVSIFHPGNIGLFSDGLIISDKNLFITEQGNFGAAGKIYKTDTNGTVLSSNDLGVNPFSLATANNKIYVTNGPANNVSVINKSTLSLITTINVGLFPQEILAIGNKVFVCNTSVFGGGTDSTVSVIDAGSDAVVGTITVRKAPSSLSKTNDGKLLIGCPGSAADGIIYKYDPVSYARLDSFVISNGLASGFDKDISVDENNDNVFFISYLNNIAKLNLSTKAVSLFINNPNTSSVYFYGYKYDSKNSKHYIADAGNFTTNGNLYIYDVNGTLIKTFTTGIAPRRIEIKN